MYSVLGPNNALLAKKCFQQRGHKVATSLLSWCFTLVLLWLLLSVLHLLLTILPLLLSVLPLLLSIAMLLLLIAIMALVLLLRTASQSREL